MPDQPGIWGKLLALTEGEVPAYTLDAYRRAGRAVYDLLDRVEELRFDRKLKGLNPWAVEPAQQVELLCAWNAFALQALGDELVAADYRANPATVGYLPPATYAQALAFYRQIEDWLSRAHQAHNNPAYRLDFRLPADLPPWRQVEPCPRSHLEAMLAATATLCTHAEAALAVFQEEGVPDGKQVALRRLHQLHADARAKAEYAEQLATGVIPQQLHEQIERHARAALDRYYHLGQLLAMPGLLEQPSPPTVRTQAAGGRPRPTLSDLGIDPWCLTDPHTRDAWGRDPRARAAIAALWAYDPAPHHTLAIQREVEAALARGDIAYATNPSGGRLGQFCYCPWAPIYVARRPLTIAGRPLRSHDQFTLDVSADAVLYGGPFRREIKIGAFHPTSRVGYCDPQGGGGH